MTAQTSSPDVALEPRWWHFAFRSQAWRRANFCAKGQHVYRWMFWRDRVRYTPVVPTVGALPMACGWEVPCIICREAKIHVNESRELPRPKHAWQARRRYRGE